MEALTKTADAKRDLAEGVRIGYVAATRARDLLVVPAVGDGPFQKGWLADLNKAIYPATGAYRNSQPAPNCPEFGEVTVLSRSAEAEEQRSAPSVWVSMKYQNVMQALSGGIRRFSP